MPTPKVTVLMSVKNGEPWVAEAVGSVLGQSLTDLRFLILDNASTDSTRETIRSFDDPRIDLVALPEDIGQTGALNQGLAMIDSEYVARMDADDVCLPDRLARQVAFLEAHPEVALLGTDALWINPMGLALGCTNFPASHGAIINAFPLGNQFAHSSVMYRHGAVMEAGGYDASFRYAQDLALWLELAARHQVANLPEIHVKIRVHPGQATRDGRLRGLRLDENVRLAERMLGLPGLPERIRQAVLFRRDVLVRQRAVVDAPTRGDTLRKVAGLIGYGAFHGSFRFKSDLARLLMRDLRRMMTDSVSCH